MNLKRIFWLLLVPVALFSACNKEDDDDNGGSEAELTVADGWVVTEVESNLGDDVIIQAFLEANDESQSGIPDNLLEVTIKGLAGDLEEIDDCEKDDVYLFLSDGTLSFDGGDLACQDGDLTTSEFFETGTWDLQGDQLYLTTDEDGDGVEETQTFTVKTLTSSTLVIEGVTPITEEEFGMAIDEDLVVTITFDAK